MKTKLKIGMSMNRPMGITVTVCLIFLGLCLGIGICGDLVLSGSNSVDGLVINEFMADNDSTTADPAGDYDDWIELYNNGSSTISLKGYFLSDDADDPEKWTFPDVTIEAGGTLCVWADEDEDQDGVHGNFKLSKSGETIILSAPGGGVVDQVVFGVQDTDVSTGRYPNGTGGFVRMTPTFGAENIEKSLQEGDVDGNDSVALNDVVLALQIMAGVEPDAAIYTGADVDGDTNIGLQEALYGLRYTGVTYITLQTNSITVHGRGASVDGSVVTIGSAGTYRISGTLVDGRIIVDTSDSDTVFLIFNGVSVASTISAPLFIADAGNVVIELCENTENYFTDSASYIYGDPEEDEPDAPVFSKSDLTIQGSGLLSVDANYNDGIKSKDGLTILGGTIVVSSVDDGIQGKDYLNIQGGTFTLDVGGDGLKSSKEGDPDLGYINISGGIFIIDSGGDAIQAETNINISGGVFTLTSGGGSNAIISADDSAKGIKAVVGITIDAGTFTINTADDSIHSDKDITINGGVFSIATGDDGVHSDSTITITGGEFDITDCYEGIESTIITINDGNIHIVSRDDGVNVAGGTDDSDGGGFPTPQNYFLYINGGYIVVDSYGDGIDVNGSIVMTGGVVLVNGPTVMNNGPLDYDLSFTISGGFLIAVGSTGMAQAPSPISTQYSVLFRSYVTKPEETLVHVQDSSGNTVFTFAPAKRYQSVCFSMPALTHNASYDLYWGGTSTGTATDGLYEGGVYTPGTKYTTFTVHDMVTNIN
ncbi:MAG: carbohydrate-binding domain-containing protein [Desulfatibacillum sp.]|nr:carbohydrate-binding domain-containing protein [Desulfatibacillum sp.]